MAGQQNITDPVYTTGDLSGIGSGIGSIFSRLFGGGSQAPQAQPAQAGSQPVAIIPRALQQAPLPPARPPLAIVPLPPARPADLGQASPAQQITLPPFDAIATPMPSRPFTPTPSPNAAALSAAAAIPVNQSAARVEPGAQCSSLERRGFDPRSAADGERPAGRGRPVDEISDRAAVAARASGHQGPVGASGRSRHASGRRAMDEISDRAAVAARASSHEGPVGAPAEQ